MNQPDGSGPAMGIPQASHNNLATIIRGPFFVWPWLQAAESRWRSTSQAAVLGVVAAMVRVRGCRQFGGVLYTAEKRP